MITCIIKTNNYTFFTSFMNVSIWRFGFIGLGFHIKPKQIEPKLLVNQNRTIDFRIGSVFFGTFFLPKGF